MAVLPSSALPCAIHAGTYPIPSPCSLSFPPLSSIPHTLLPTLSFTPSLSFPPPPSIPSLSFPPPSSLPSLSLQPPVRSSLVILIAGSDAAWRQHMPPPLHPVNLTAALHKECTRAHLPCEVLRAQEDKDPCTDQFAQKRLGCFGIVYSQLSVGQGSSLGFQGVLKWIREQLKGWEGKGGSTVERKGVRGEFIEDDEYACAGREVEHVGVQYEEEDDLWDSDENPESDKKT
ncbi:unnamed protein product [Closterium sp. NIES-65]|nr:unnamed protein product [Closterium sp. NIES-65]